MSTFNKVVGLGSEVFLSLVVLVVVLAVIFWFVYSLISYFKMPKGYRVSKRGSLIVSGFAFLVVCYLFYNILSSVLE